MRRTEQLLEKAGYKVQGAVEEGYPQAIIIDYAKRWNADLIVLGSHGRKGLDRFMMGSVAESVARYARFRLDRPKSLDSLRDCEWSDFETRTPIHSPLLIHILLGYVAAQVLPCEEAVIRMFR